MIKTSRTKRRRDTMESTTIPKFPKSIILNILSRLPVKSVYRFKCVSKSLLTLLESPSFVAAHLRNSARNPSLLIRYYSHLSRFDFGFWLVRVDGTLHDLEIPFFKDLICFPKVVGSCNGLVCLDVSSSFGSDFILWNIGTNHFVRLSQPALLSQRLWKFSLGFGYNREQNDYVLMRIASFENKNECLDDETRVEVYKTSTASWEEILMNEELLCTIYAGQEAVSVEGELHWMANGLGVLAHRKFIVSFDMKQESFRRRLVPEFAPEDYVKAVRYKESFGLAVYPGMGSKGNCLELWVMNEGKKWSKEISIGMPRIACPIGSWKDSEIIIKKENELFVFNPGSRQTVNLPVGGGILGNKYSYKVFTYVDSLVSVNGEMATDGEIEEEIR